jgi:hypothetical protein
MQFHGQLRTPQCSPRSRGLRDTVSPPTAPGTASHLPRTSTQASTHTHSFHTAVRSHRVEREGEREKQHSLPPAAGRHQQQHTTTARGVQHAPSRGPEYTRCESCSSRIWSNRLYTSGMGCSRNTAAPQRKFIQPRRSKTTQVVALPGWTSVLQPGTGPTCSSVASTVPPVPVAHTRIASRISNAVVESRPVLPTTHHKRPPGPQQQHVTSRTTAAQHQHSNSNAAGIHTRSLPVSNLRT